MMGLITTALGAFLCLVGLFCYLASRMMYPMALLPTGFGVLFLLLGLLARVEKLRMHAMHAAALFSLIGLLVTAGGGLAGVGQYLFGAMVIRPMVALSQLLTALSCGVFLVICVQSFIEARSERQANERTKTRSRVR